MIFAVSHFASIGITANSAEELQAVMEPVMERAENPRELGEASQNHLYFRDESGAAVAAHLGRDRSVECMTPFFDAPDGGTRWRVRTSAPAIDQTCVHCSGTDCDVLDENGEMVTRTTVQWLFFSPWRRWLEQERTYRVQLAGFASAIALCATAEEFENAQATAFGARDPDAKDKPMRLAECAFLPMGMFGNAGDVGARARALLTGGVKSVARRINSATGGAFAHVRVATLGGELDLVAPVEILEDAPANPLRVLADVWLVGRPVDVTPPPPASFWKRLTGKG